MMKMNKQTTLACFKEKLLQTINKPESVNTTVFYSCLRGNTAVTLLILYNSAEFKNLAETAWSLGEFTVQLIQLKFAMHSQYIWDSSAII